MTAVRARALLGAVALAAAALVLGGPAPAASAAACSGSTGVTVVVDYGALGGIQVGCAAGDPGSGLTALHGAGFATTGTRKDGPGFVCRINGAPASDPCVVTPPTSAYWSYWHAARGGSWGYSSLGAGGYNPVPGSVEGWSFGAGARPGIAPPAAPAPAPVPTTKAAPVPPPKPKPVPTTARPVPGGPATTAGPPRAPGPAGTVPGRPAPGAGTPGAGRTTAPTTAGSRPATTGPGAGVGSTGPTGGGAGSTGSAAGAPPTSDPGPVPAAVEPAGSSTPVAPFVLGAVVVAGLGTTAAVLARRRRAG